MIKRFLFATAASYVALVGGGAQAAETLPAFRILSGAPTTPATAYATYAARDSGFVHTDGLCRDYASNAAICPGGARPRAPEIIALANGLKHDPDLIYEYVRNSIETEFVFGSHKGSLGAIINHSGTAFDQALLMVELLRESSITARFRFGDIQLNGQQFYDWAGIQDARAACAFLAAGAIPATVNGGGDCNLSGAVSTVTMAHIWVEAEIGGMTYQFDPAFKPHEFRTGINVRSSMTSATGVALSTALQNAQTSDGGVTLSNLNQTGLASLLTTDATALAARLEARDLQSADLTTAIGGGIIKPATRPSSNWRDASLPYVATVRATWADIPNAYRARVKLSRRLANNNLRTYADFYTDEVFGRKLEVDSRLLPAASSNILERRPQVVFDSVPLFDDPEPYVHNGPPPAYLAYAFNLRLEIDHPFADPTYGDDVLERTIAGANPVHVMFAPGPVTSALGGKWSGEQAGDRAFDAIGCSTSDEGSTGCSVPFGDAMRAGLSASWLSQATAAAAIHAALANAVQQQQHSLGFFYSPQGLSTTSDGEFFAGGGEVADIVSGFSLTSKTSDTLKRRAALHAIAATFSALEGSVAQQASDSTDATSTARRFAWANAPGVDSPVSTPRGFRSFTANGTGPEQTDFLFDGVASPQNSATIPYRERLQSSVNSYLQSGYDVVAAMDATLGPGEWITSNFSNRGGAFLATRYLGGEPTEIAHVSLSFGNDSKGGGLPNSTSDLSQKLVDKLKDNFQDRSSALAVSVETGLVAYKSPELAAIGSGEFPYKLTQRVELRGGGLPALVRNPTSQLDTMSLSMGLFASNDPEAGEFSNDGLAAMGTGRLAATAPTLAAFSAMQDIWSAAPSTGRELAGLLAVDWWTWRLMQNAVTVRQGAAQRTFTKTGPGVFKEAAGGAQVTVTGGDRTLVAKLWDVGGGNRAIVRIWCPVGSVVQFDLREASGSIVRSGTSFSSNSASFCGISPSPIPVTQILPSGISLSRFAGAAWPENRYSSWGWKNSLGRGFVNHMPYDPNEVVNSPTPFIHNCYSSISGSQPFPTSAPFVLEFKDHGGKAYRLRFRAPVKRSLTQRPDDSCKLEAVFTPGDIDTPDEKYVYDGDNRVVQAFDAIAIRQPAVRKPYRFYIAEGYRGERLDPLDKSYAVETMAAGGKSVAFPALDPLAAETIVAVKLKRNIDELGRTTETLLDGRGRVIEHDLPEHNKTRFRYDERDNVVEQRQIAKPAFSGDADLVVRASWDTIWNKPAWIRDARGAQTDFSYWPATAGGASGQLYQLIQPAVTGGRPTFTFEYNATGLPSQKTDARNIITKFGYNGQGDLTEVVQDLGGLNIRSCSRYDDKGDLKEAIDPRAGLSTCPQ